MISELEKIVGERERVVPAREIAPRFLGDVLGRIRGNADALVFPKTTAEVSAILSFAFRRGIPVTPRGAGTNLVGSTVPHGGIVLDFSLMNRIVELDEKTFTLTVEPGVRLKDVQAFVEARGFFYPPDPGEKTATIGGNIATNAGGMRAVKYGVTRDYVRELEVVLADGTVAAFGSKNVKDASGLSLKNLVVGSEGTLAAITKCRLRLLPKPARSRTALAAFSSLEKGIAGVSALLKSGASPTSVEFLERDVIGFGERFTGIKFPCERGSACLLLTFDGTESAVAEGIAIAREAALQAGAEDFFELETERAAEAWAIRGCLVKAVESVSEQEPVDLVVPLDCIADFIASVKSAEKKFGLRIVSFGHAGDGNVHLCILRGVLDAATWEKTLAACMTELYGRAHALGGLTSGEHGIGIAKRAYFLANTSPENLAVMRVLKNALDPKHIFNDHISYLE